MVLGYMPDKPCAEESSCNYRFRLRLWGRIRESLKARRHPPSCTLKMRYKFQKETFRMQHSHLNGQTPLIVFHLLRKQQADHNIHIHAMEFNVPHSCQSEIRKCGCDSTHNSRIENRDPRNLRFVLHTDILIFSIVLVIY